MKEYSFPGLVGRIDRYERFETQLVTPRRVDVWLPTEYKKEGQDRYAVLYMMDGQNLFNPQYSKYSHVDWGIDETLSRLIDEKKVRNTLVVGIWSNRQRVIEYMPQKAAVIFKNSAQKTTMRWLKKGFTLSDQFLRFIVEELKPKIDATYRTMTDRDNTAVMGSSMGGLISLYALCEYPDQFGGAGCVSTHFPIAEGAMLDYMREKLPPAGRHKLYFDYGTGTLDAAYEPYQDKADQIVQAKGYQQGVDWLTQKFAGHDHSETYWRQRVDIPLKFLLGSREERTR